MSTFDIATETMRAGGNLGSVEGSLNVIMFSASARTSAAGRLDTGSGPDRTQALSSKGRLSGSFPLVYARTVAVDSTPDAGLGTALILRGGFMTPPRVRIFSVGQSCVLSRVLY